MMIRRCYTEVRDRQKGRRKGDELNEDLVNSIAYFERVVSLECERICCITVDGQRRIDKYDLGVYVLCKEMCTNSLDRHNH